MKIDKEIIVLTRTLFEEGCSQRGYDLEAEKECGFLEDLFFAWLYMFMMCNVDRTGHDLEEVAQVFLDGFCESRENRLKIFSAYLEFVAEMRNQDTDNDNS